jgi:membrane-bound serine protease (ClpP class)
VTDQLLFVILVIFLGYVLLLLELLVIPGFGITGIAGLFALGVGAYLAVRHFGGTAGGLVVAGVIALTTVTLVGIPRTRFGRKIIHRDSLEGAKAGESPVAVGARGVAESDLRPAGIALFGEHRESVVTDGEFIPQSAPVRVTLVEGARVVVESVDESANCQEGAT